MATYILIFKQADVIKFRLPAKVMAVSGVIFQSAGSPSLANPLSCYEVDYFVPPYGIFKALVLPYSDQDVRVAKETLEQYAQDPYYSKR